MSDLENSLQVAVISLQHKKVFMVDYREMFRFHLIRCFNVNKTKKVTDKKMLKGFSQQRNLADMAHIKCKFKELSVLILQVNVF